MQYTELGKTKENVSILGFGAMRLQLVKFLAMELIMELTLLIQLILITVPESTVTETAKFS